jgi:hypothetical protein
MSGTPITATTDLLKVSDELGLVFGYAIVCMEKNDAGDWVQHFDTQGHHIPESVMLKAAADFALTEASIAKSASKDMHEGDDIQVAPFLFPMTTEMADALGMDIKKSGLLIGLKPTAEVLAMYKSGDRTGFSIGGSGTLEEVTA